MTEPFREAPSEAEFATKRNVELMRQDIRELKLRFGARFEGVDSKLTLVQWILALVVAAEAVPLLAFPVTA